MENLDGFKFTNMNTLGNIRLAYKQFCKDLKNDPDYINFKLNSSKDCFTGDKTTIKINYHLFEIDSKETRKLNKKLKKHFK